MNRKGARAGSINHGRATLPAGGRFCELDGHLLTLEDTVELFNLILETKLSSNEKADLVAFLRTL